MKKVEGNKTMSETVKERGQVLRHEASHEGSGKTGEHAMCGSLREVGFEAGRTIELRRFEFCRIRLGLRVRVPAGVEYGDAMEACQKFILAALAAEESAVAGGNPNPNFPEGVVGVLDGCRCRCLSVSYGLTLKSGTKEFESHQVDLIEEVPVSDGTPILSALEQLSNEMAAYLGTQHSRIKSIDSKTGL